MEWSECLDVERRPDVLSGAWVIRGTRILADAVIDNAEDGYTPEQIAADIYEGLSVDTIRRMIRFARSHAKSPA